MTVYLFFFFNSTFLYTATRKGYAAVVWGLITPNPVSKAGPYNFIHFLPVCKSRVRSAGIGESERKVVGTALRPRADCILPRSMRPPSPFPSPTALGLRLRNSVVRSLQVVNIGA